MKKISLKSEQHCLICLKNIKDMQPTIKEEYCSKQDWKHPCIHQNSSFNSVKENFHEEKLTCENQTWCKLKTQIWVFYSILSILLASSECENSMSLKIIEFSQRWFWWVFFIIEFWVEFLTLLINATKKSTKHTKNISFITQTLYISIFLETNHHRNLVLSI